MFNVEIIELKDTQMCVCEYFVLLLYIFYLEIQCKTN